jgi:phospholipid/cholesterol/gamma-HCH transport system ATP-binding protein
METPLIEFRDVTKRFGEQTVLDEVNVKIYPNQITTILGKSGTGKSVFLKHIIGLLEPDGGTILFDGRALQEMKKKDLVAQRSRMSYMFQNNALFDSMTVFENVALPLRRWDLSKKEVIAKVEDRLDQMDLGGTGDKYPGELSGGMQKRVALARTLVTDPAVVLFDEPTTGQDPIRKQVILSMIARYRKKFGFTAVLISHDIPDVLFISDRLVLLWEGKAAFEGSYDELMKSHHPMIEEFLRGVEGPQDEFTGLLSQNVFTSRFAATRGSGVEGIEGISALVFGVNLYFLEETMGHQAAVEVLKVLGEYSNKHFTPYGGFSTRHSRDRIVTILPHTGRGEAMVLLNQFAKELESSALPGIEANIRARTGGDSCFEIQVRAGVTEGAPDDELDEIIDRAQADRDVVARFSCEEKVVEVKPDEKILG